MTHTYVALAGDEPPRRSSYVRLNLTNATSACGHIRVEPADAQHLATTTREVDESTASQEEAGQDGDITAWLLHQLQHDEDAALRLVHHSMCASLLRTSARAWGMDGRPLASTSEAGECDCGVDFDHSRTLTLVQAHRRVIELHTPEPSIVGFSQHGAPTRRRWDVEVVFTCRGCSRTVDDPAAGCDTIRALALAYQARAGFQSTWMD